MVEICIGKDDQAQASSVDDTFSAGFDAAFAAIALVQRLMSFHDQSSDLARINRASVGEWVAIDPHTAHVLECTESLRQASGGIFDIDCATSLVASGYLPGLPLIGQPATAGPAWCFDGPNQVRKLRPALLDLGGIAKGYAVDLAVTALREADISSALVNAGGDMRAFGPHAWPVLLRDPAPPHGAKYRTELHNMALASSGAYFATRPHVSNPAGQPVSHLLDGRSKQPVCRADAVSVCAPTCMLADALCKVVFASGDSAHPLLAQFAATGYIIPA